MGAWDEFKKGRDEAKWGHQLIWALLPGSFGVSILVTPGCPWYPWVSWLIAIVTVGLSVFFVRDVLFHRSRHR
jgi:hypothetical protein